MFSFPVDIEELIMCCPSRTLSDEKSNNVYLDAGTKKISTFFKGEMVKFVATPLSQGVGAKLDVEVNKSGW